MLEALKGPTLAVQVRLARYVRVRLGLFGCLPFNQVARERVTSPVIRRAYQLLSSIVSLGSKVLREGKNDWSPIGGSDAEGSLCTASFNGNEASRDNWVVDGLRRTLIAMGTEAKKIFEQALALPENERADLADALNETLQLEEGDLSPEWKSEISRRIDAVEQGESQIIPGNEVEARIRARLANL